MKKLNKKQRFEISFELKKACLLIDNSLNSYKPYMPDHNHEEAIKDIELAIEVLTSAKSLIQEKIKENGNKEV